MKKYISKSKLSKKEKRKLDSQKRILWDISPVTKTVPGKKVYNRKKARKDIDYSGGSLFFENIILNYGYKVIKF